MVLKDLVTPLALTARPHEAWAALREHAPVYPSPALGVTFVTRYDDVVAVCRDADAFSAHVPESPLSRTVGPNFMHADGAAHKRIRDLIAPLLRPAIVRTSHLDTLVSEATRLVGVWGGGKPFDAVADLAAPLADLLMERMLGITEPAPGTFDRWFRAIGAGAANFERDPRIAANAAAVAAEIDDALRVALASGAPDDSLVGVFAHAGEAYEFDDLGATARLFVIGGLQEPRDLLGITVIALMTHPDELASVAGDRGRVIAAIEEAARWEAPVGTVTRVTTRDLELSGVKIDAGTVVAGVIASANRDARRWRDPDRYDVGREEGPNLAFAVGAHACVGAAAARLLVRVGIEALLDRLATAEFVEAPPLIGYEFRGPRAVRLRDVCRP